MLNWRHSGFNVYCGKAIWPHNEEGLENLARYIIRASFSQERMTYVAANDSSDAVSKVLYQSKDGTSTKTFDALDWLAQLVTHIPNKGESASVVKLDIGSDQLTRHYVALKLMRPLYNSPFPILPLLKSNFLSF